MKIFLSTAAGTALLIVATGCASSNDSAPRSLSGDAPEKTNLREVELGQSRTQIIDTRVAVNDDKPNVAMPNDAKEAPAMSDQDFVTHATIGGMFEVQSGQLALQKSQTANIRDIAAKIVSDHTAVGAKLKDLAESKGKTLPTALDESHQAMYDKLSKLDGTAFDSEFASQQIVAHQKAIALFQAESKMGADADLKKFASDTVPALQGHLDMLQRKGNEKQNVGATPVMPK